MEFVAYLETSKKYDNKDVVEAFHKLLQYGQRSLEENGKDLHAEIIKDFMNNYSFIEQE